MRGSSPRRTGVPSIPEIVRSEGGIDSALKALKEATEVGYGRRGDPLDRFVTMRDLKDANIGTVVIGAGGAALSPPPGSGSGAPYVPYRPPDDGSGDFTVPPAPTGVTGRGVPPDSIMITWDPPNYGNHAYAEVYALLETITGGARSLGEVQAAPGDAYAGRADGTIFMHRNLVNVVRQGQNPLDMALRPSVRYYWVRFVSTAGVRGPFAPLLGAAVAMSIDPVLVLDAMIENVEATPIYANLRGYIGEEPNDPIIEAGGVLGYITAVASNIDGRLASLWSVNMRHNLQNGLVYAAGFGIGMESDEETGESLSTFIVNANQFAIMGNQNGLPGAAVRGVWLFPNGPDVIAFYWLTATTHGFAVGGRVSLAAHTGRIRIDEETELENPFCGMQGIEGNILFAGPAPQGGHVLQVSYPSGASIFQPPPGGAPWWDPQQPAYNQAWVRRFNAAALPPTSMPFIVDTTRRVVGIRGDLIVDGLVRATAATFGELTATNAFVDHMRSNIIDANVIVGQRIIAGAPGIGAISTGEYQAISNYVIELNNPIANNFAMRFWRPSSGDVRFSLDRLGNMVVGGHMSVAGNGVIGTTGTNLASFGGAGADGNYAMWIGPQSAYGTNGGGRTEATGLFWAKDNGRAGFNADLFLGANAFGLPVSIPTGNPGSEYTFNNNTLRATTLVQTAVSSSPIAVRALRSGAAASTVVIVSGFLVAHNSGETSNGEDKFFWLHAELIGSSNPNAPTVAPIQSILLDDYYPESMPYTLQNVVTVPAGNYWVRLRVQRLDDRNMSINQGWTVVSFQTTTSGGLAP